MRPDAMKFIGLENYQKLFSDKNFWLALKNTVYFTVIVVPCQCVLALALALLVSKKFRGVAVFPDARCTVPLRRGMAEQLLPCTLHHSLLLW